MTQAEISMKILESHKKGTNSMKLAFLKKNQ